MAVKLRDIIDGEDLKPLLWEAAEEDGRAEITGLLLAAYDRGMDRIRAAFQSGQINGPRQAAWRAYLLDRLVHLLYDVTAHKIMRRGTATEGERLAVIATGGYGRAELSPFSDVDLLFLHPYKCTGWCEQVTEYMLYVLWDLRLTVGQAVRSPSDCIRLAQSDLSIKTSLLETRFLAGDTRLYQALQESFEAEVIAGTGQDFVDAKLAERDARHQRFGDSRYVVEPHLKDGKGGLRDLHTLFWIVKYLYRIDKRQEMVDEGVLSPAEMREFRRAHRFFMTVRAHLHYLTGRAEERLTFDVQTALAGALGYNPRAGLSGVERFMKHYFLHAKMVGDLTRVVCAVLEERAEKKPLLSLSRWLPRRVLDGFRVDNDRLTFPERMDLTAEPVRMIEIFRVAQQHGLDIHPEALRRIKPTLRQIDAQVRRDARANAAFLELLSDPDHPDIHLTRMNEAGVLGRFVPDFGRVVAMMQFDMYHHYTVDAHTIRAIGLLAAIERGELAEAHPLATRVLPEVPSRRALYVAVLCHDIAKGRNGDHSILGAQVAKRLGPRLGLTAEETQLVSWLVRWHLMMSHYAFKRDLADPQTLEEFATAVAAPERLKMLLVLTVVDIKAVSPESWNNWKAQLLRDLYQATEDRLRHGHGQAARHARVSAQKQALADRLEDWPQAALDGFFARFDDSYWMGEDIDSIEGNLHLVASVEAMGLSHGVSTRVDQAQDVARVSVYVRDRRGLFADLAGALAGCGADVGEAKLHTSADGWALDNFSIQTFEGSAYDEPRRLDRLHAAVSDTLQGRHPVRQAIEARGPGDRRRRRAALFTVTPSVFIDQGASARSTVLEVNARDRLGLLYDLALALTELRLTVVSAHVTTFGERAVDTFYVTDARGQKVTNPQRLKTIEARLLAAAQTPVKAQAA
ncbi:MAG: [protein-PII] uridylyltransferase [Rhodothalassiaceae bacterium]